MSTSSSRIIRGSDRIKRPRISRPSEPASEPELSSGRLMEVEKQAFEKGYAEGERIGRQMGEQMIGSMVKRYEKSVSDLAVAHRRLVESMEKEAVRLALAVAESVIEREIRTDPDVVNALVAVALKRMEGHPEVVLRVSPDDFEMVSATVSSINPAVRIEQANELERGDFMIDTRKTHLDGRMSSRIRQIGRSLFEDQ